MSIHTGIAGHLLYTGGATNKQILKTTPFDGDKSGSEKKIKNSPNLYYSSVPNKRCAPNKNSAVIIVKF